MEHDSRQMFQAIAAATGLSPIFAPGLVRRALVDAGVAAKTATVEEYERAIPALEARLRAFLRDANELAEALARVRSVVERARRSTPRDGTVT